MARKREATYTSVSVNKTHFHFIADLKEYAQRELGLTITGQQAMDFCLDTGWERRAELKEYARAKILDPRVATYLQLQEELKQAGLLP